MEPRKIASLVAGGVLLLIAALITWDVLVVTDQERLEDFADAVTEEISRENIDLALSYVDPQAQPILIEFRGESMKFDSDRASFDAMARSRLRPYEGTGQQPLRKTVELDNDRAHVATETFSRRGRVSVDWDLRKHDGRWLVSRMSIHR